MKYLSLALVFMFGIILNTNAQDLNLPALSPTAKITQQFSTSNIEVDYSRPSARGRKIFGGLVPYGEMWRTGANAATKITIGEDLYIGGSMIKAGQYSLYTIPGATEWTIIINKSLKNWGNSNYSADEDVARFKVKPKKINNMIETFTITIGDITFNSCNIVLKWEYTKVIIPVKADSDERIAKEIEKAVEHPSIPYYQAARYYNTVDKNLDKALEYITKALEERNDAFWMWNLKAQIAQKLNKKDIAIEAANKAMEVSKGTSYEGEQKRANEKIINSFK